MLRDFLSDLVVIGGWVPQIHRQLGAVRNWRSDPVRTLELDVLVPEPLEGAESVVDALAQAGFRPTGEAKPPATWEREGAGGERIEFFVPHTGTGRAIGATRGADKAGQLGAVSLPGLARLAECTVTVQMPLGKVSSRTLTTTVRVPDLGAFLVQKGAIFPRRPDPARKAKDVLYIVEVMAAGEHVEAYVETRILSLQKALAPDLHTATNNLGLLLTTGSPLSRLLDPVAEAVGEIEGSSIEAARGKTIGHLTDFHEMISRFS